jgi:hypothetical protein
MAFTSPIALTLHGASRNLIRVNQDNFGSTWRASYQTSGGTPVEVIMKLSHQKEGKSSQSVMERHIVDIKITEYPTDASPIVFQTYTHVRQPLTGLPATGVELISAISTWMNANDTNLLDWEN